MSECKRPPGLMLWLEDVKKLKKLNDDGFRLVIESLCTLAESGEESQLEGMEGMAYAFMAERVRENCRKYEAMCIRNRNNRNNPRSSPVVTSGERSSPLLQTKTKTKTKTIILGECEGTSPSGRTSRARKNALFLQR